jgi:hypothetical protein
VYLINEWAFLRHNDDKVATCKEREITMVPAMVGGKTRCTHTLGGRDLAVYHILLAPLNSRRTGHRQTHTLRDDGNSKSKRKYYISSVKFD